MPSNQDVNLGTSNITAEGSSSVFDATYCLQGCVQAAWAAADAGDGTVTLKYSLDGTNYYNYAAATTMTVGAGSKLWELAYLAKFYKVTIAKGTNTAGTVTVRAIGKA